MKTGIRRRTIQMMVMVAALTAVNLSNAAAEPAFTYQGQLKQDGMPVTGEADFEFHLWDAETGGTQLASNYLEGVSLDNGLFTVQLDFEALLFDGSPRYLEVYVAVPSGGAFTPLAGRQPITPAPYALALPALRTEQDAISPNVIAGHGDNIITEGAHGVTLSGGGSAGTGGNTVTDHFGTIGGGTRNRAGNNVGTTDDATAATVGGGSYNQANAQYATVAGGGSNYANGVGSAIGGGSDNTASGGRAAVGGGEENNATGAHAVIAGGSANNADGQYAAIGGGVDNIASGHAGTVPGGRGNRANGENSFAAGYRAQADHEATFVWSDATDTTFFTSTGPNQFLVNAAGGVGINTNAPAAALHIAGTPGTDGVMFPDGTLQTTAATGGGGGDGHSLDAVDGSPTDAVYVEANGKVRMNRGGLTVLDNAGHGISFTSNSFYFREATSEDPVYEYSSSTDKHVFYTSGSRSLLVSDNGGVGIGMAWNQDPSAKLHVDATTGVSVLTTSTGAEGVAMRANASEDTQVAIEANATGTALDGGYPAPNTAGKFYASGEGSVGVYGHVDQGSYGIHGQNDFDHGSGVFGEATGSGEAIGVYGKSASTIGRGVYGNATASTGATHGVYGRAYSPDGIGVYGLGAATTGDAIGVRGQTNSSSGYAAYFTGGRNYFEGRVGIGVENPQTTLHLGGTPDVDGIVFPDGTLQKTAAAGGGGDTLWSEAVNGIFYTAGNVGIGTSNPTRRLHVAGQSLFSDLVSIGAGSPPQIDLMSNGHVTMREADNTITVDIDAEGPDGGALVYLSNDEGQSTVEIDADEAGDAALRLSRAGPVETIVFDADVMGQGAEVLLSNGSGQEVIDLDADADGNGATLELNSSTGQTRFSLQASEEGDQGARLGLRQTSGTETIILDADAKAEMGGALGGAVLLNRDDGRNGIVLSAHGGSVLCSDPNDPTNSSRAFLSATALGGGLLNLYDSSDDLNVRILGGTTYDGNIGGAIQLRNSGDTTLELLANYGGTGYSRVITDVIEIKGGADLSEQFDVTGADGRAKPGMVVAIDGENPGKLVVAGNPYDRKVAGVISGAGGVKPGMLMGHEGTAADGQHPVALTGRVWTWCAATNGAIEPGDMLTTSSTPGHAMKVLDHGRAQGAIIGKAMSSLSEGTGLVLILVSLQ